MNVPPLIGITMYAVNENGDVTLPENYVASVRRAGGVPLLIAPGESQTDEMLGRIDGMVLAGGGDICPSCYGADLHESIYMVNPERDEMELQLARQLIDQGIPTLAICRGFQIINVALGGTLHVHVPELVGESVLHRAPPRAPVPHRVSVESSSRLAAIMNASEIDPMSWHHQAVDMVPDELSIVARAPDGIIEAAELLDHPWLYCVQWHPEITADRDPSQQRLFDALVFASGKQD